MYEERLALIDPEILSLIERFQTGIVGLIGFLGVIWTLRANAKSARDAHQRVVTTRRRAMRRVLAAEFRNHFHAINANAEMVIEGSEPLSVGKSKGTLSKHLVEDLGLLELGEIDVAVNAIISLDGLYHALENIAVDQSETRLLIPTNKGIEFQAIMSTTAKALDIAVKTLELSDEA